MRSIIFYFLWGIFFPLSAQTLSGYVREAGSGEALIGVSVYDSLSGRGVYSNAYGFYSLRLPAGRVVIKASLPSYTTYRREWALTQDQQLDIALAQAGLDEVVIEASRQPAGELGKISIPISQLKAVPALLGERDVLKALALLPGVSNGLEGTSGLLVRGGSPDQNLMLLDGAIVYNASHLFGFFSVFNPDAIKHVDLYKGGFPARYGGRLSSVVDIAMKEGNREKFAGEASIGILSSRLLLEGPIDSSTSYMFSGRLAYLGLLLAPTKWLYNSGSLSSYFNYWLYDVNGKLNHQFKDKSRLYLSFYGGQDAWLAGDGRVNVSESETRLAWGNQTATLRYHRTLSKKLFLNSMFTYSRYRYEIGTEQKDLVSTADTSFTIQRAFTARSEVRDFAVKTALDYYPAASVHIRLGGEAIRHRYLPQAIEERGNLPQIVNTRAFVHATEYAAWWENEISLRPGWRVNAGLRLSAFSVEDTTFAALEPRISSTWQMPNNWSLTGGYSEMNQYLHLLSNNGAGLPNDVWVPVTRRVAPQRARQWAAGLSKSFPRQQLEISLEGYWKRSTRLIDYAQGQDFFGNFNQNWQDAIEQNGIGEAYGMELFAHKKQGRFTGWLAYTLSWNQRQFANINGGAWYPGRYDRRHDLSLTSTWEIDKYWTISGTWVYASGTPVTLPVAKFDHVNGYPVYIYGDRHNRRMPAYHRMDIGFEYRPRGNTKRSVSFGAYNVYNRKNPFFLDIGRVPIYLRGGSNIVLGYGDPQVIQRSLLPILPWLAYSWKF